MPPTTPLADRPLRVALSTSVGQRGKSGVATYLFGLIEGLLATSTPRIHLTLFGLAADRPLYEHWLDRCAWEEVSELWRPAVRDIFWHQFIFPRRLQQIGCDLVHIPSYRRVLARAPCPQVLTIHDCAPFQLRGKYDWARQLYTQRLVVPLARRAQRIITVSAATADDVTHFYGIDRAALTVIWNGINHERFQPPVPGTPAPADYPYFLYVARLEHPAKNHLRLIEAFEQIATNNAAPTHRLVLAGADWHGAEIIHQRIAASPHRDRILTPGFLPLADLPRWYANATAMVYPSLFEGFGLPPVEAMACSCPVICSTRGALGEVVGDAARLVDPENIGDIAAALLAMLDSKTRKQWQERGLHRARLFSWLGCATATAAVYQRTAR